ncbi:helix-turn-helix domain-containing protein [Rhizomonospora bruguierae]|uniref:helix-turn-helix domain-containing protein n=1 Tax=Rhizomonospora bruguierae TaxID=1581705 RepID=UPI001BCE443C|nr:helix-turn-helix transcriptional regulator [Micromonospora sp. NBRC 107566]
MANAVSQPEFGRRLRGLRVARGLSQRDLAAGVVSPSYVSLLESGARVPTLEVALQIARALGVPLTNLVEQADVAAGEPSRASADRLVRELLARSAADHGDLAAAADRFDHAYREARDAGMVLAALQYGLALDEIFTLKADYERRYRLGVELAGLATAIGAPELMIKVDTERASAARDTGRLAEALECACRALGAIEGTQFFHSAQHVRLLSVTVSVLCETGGSADVPRLIEEMLEVADQIDSPPLSGRAHWTASVAYARIGDERRAVAHIRRASQMLTSPSTPLRDWARFTRSAASALLDAEVDLAETEPFLKGARAAIPAADLPGEVPLLASLEARYALAAGRAEAALELVERVDEGALSGFELVRLLVTKGRALHRTDRPDDAVEQLRRAARLCDELAAYQLAARVWREIDQVRTG